MISAKVHAIEGGHRHATPARSDHTGLGPLCATVFAPGLAPCAGLAPGRDAGARGPHGDGRLAGDGAGDGAPLHQLPSGLEPGHLVGPPGQSDSVGAARSRCLVPPGATIVLGADDTVERRSGRQDHGQRLLSRCGALHQEARHPLLWPEMGVDDALGAGALEPAGVGVALSHRPVLAGRASAAQRRHKTSVDWVRQMMKQVRRWLPGRRLVLVVDGGFAAVSLALACVKSQVVMVSRLRWDAALYHPPGPQPPGKRGPKPTEGQAPTQLAGLGGALRYALGDRGSGLVRRPAQNSCGSSRAPPCGTPRGLPPVAIRYVLVCDPEGKLRMEAFFCTDLQATPVQILAVGRHALVGRGHL